MEKIYIKKLYFYKNENNKDIQISGIYGLIGENSNITSKDLYFNLPNKNAINDKNNNLSNVNVTLIINNSIYNTDHSFDMYNNKIIILNNSIANLLNIYNVSNYAYIGKNSFVNFPSNYTINNYNIRKYIIANDEINLEYCWTSKLAIYNISKSVMNSSTSRATDETLSGLYWIEKNQYSRYVLDKNIINNITIDNSNKLSNNLIDNNNECNILYNNLLVGGNYKEITFRLDNYLASNNNISGFTISNNKNYYTILNSNQYKTFTFNNLVEVINIEKFKTINFSFSELYIYNSNVLLYGKFNIDNLSAFNSNLSIASVPGNFKDIFYTNIFINNNNNFIFKNKKLSDLDNDYYTNTAILLSANNNMNIDFYPLNGNKIISNETTTNNNRNNNYRYGLLNHTHKSFSTYTSNSVNGLLFPTQYNVTHKVIDNSNYKSLFSKGGNVAYLPLSCTFRDTFIQQLVNLPIGSIIQYYQIKKGNEWLPKVPYGFYELSPDKNIAKVIDTDDCNSLTYNALLLNVIATNENKFMLPKGEVSYFNNGTVRLIHILKYSELIKERY